MLKMLFKYAIKIREEMLKWKQYSYGNIQMCTNMIFKSVKKCFDWSILPLL